MFDREEFKKEIAAQLVKMPRDKCVAFAVRSAMRVLPLLAVSKKKILFNRQNEVFWFWQKTDINKHLLVVLKTYGCNIETALTKNFYSAVDVFGGRAAYRAGVYAKEADADTAVVYAAYAAGDATATAIDADDAGAAADAAKDVAYAADGVGDANAYILQAIQQDLIDLKKLSIEDFLKQPLWLEPAPVIWQVLYRNFKNDVLSLNAGFEVWLDWYEDRLQGKPIDIELLKQWNRIPDEIQQQGAAKVNAYIKNLVQKNASQP